MSFPHKLSPDEVKACRSAAASSVQLTLAAAQGALHPVSELLLKVAKAEETMALASRSPAGDTRDSSFHFQIVSARKELQAAKAQLENAIDSLKMAAFR